jgi:branched-chain amino acid transport system permease protein
MVGSIIIGVFVFVVTAWTPPAMDEVLIPPEMKTIGALLVMIVLLMLRPQGIFGRKERIG